jgi:hypothetical protein
VARLRKSFRGMLKNCSHSAISLYDILAVGLLPGADFMQLAPEATTLSTPYKSRIAQFDAVSDCRRLGWVGSKRYTLLGIAFAHFRSIDFKPIWTSLADG